jgi:hypothetical protein
MLGSLRFVLHDESELHSIARCSYVKARESSTNYE